MNTIKELGISPTPWRVLEWNGVSSQTCYTVESATHTVCELNNDDNASKDAYLIAAAPDLYKCLHDAIMAICRMCPHCSVHHGYECNEPKRKCCANVWRKVLADTAEGKNRNE